MDVIAQLDTDEARTLTEEIRSTVERLHMLLLHAYEGQAWSALGYASWREYATTEFTMSQSHAYRLLDQARVVREIEAASGSPIGETPNEAQARELARAPEGDRAQIWEQVNQDTDGHPTAAAIRAVVDRAPDPISPSGGTLGVGEYWDASDPDDEDDEEEGPVPALARPTRVPEVDVVATVSALIAKAEDAAALAGCLTSTHLATRPKEAAVWGRRLHGALDPLQRLAHTFEEHT